ncbi:neural-cadherin isoform X3 [Folsomia candida]|nr:neural-cadherin isoform X3 [Folsomia candida]
MRKEISKMKLPKRTNNSQSSSSPPQSLLPHTSASASKSASSGVGYLSCLWLLLCLLSPVPSAMGVAIVRRNVVKIPHDVFPGYSIKKFGAGSTGHVFHLMPNDYSDYFTVLDNGILMSTANMTDLIDHPVSLVVREELPESNVSTNHTVQLYVLDSHNMLKFKDSYEASVLENSAVGSPLKLKTLVRPTSDPDRKIKYEIIGGDGKGYFHAKTNSSNHAVEIFTTKVLDREEQKSYSLMIKAYDVVGVDTAVTKITVTVLDENDNAPIFSKTTYRWAIPTNTTRFSPAGKVHAEDADGDHVSYRLTNNNPTFVIVPQTGEILLVNKPEEQSYQLEVQAHDVRTPSLFASQHASVFIEVGSPEYLEGVLAQQDPDEGVVVVILDGDDDIDDDDDDMDSDQDVDLPRRNRGPSYRRAKRRVTRAVRPTMRKEFPESDGQQEGKVVFELTRENEFETFKIRDENPWVTVEPNGAVRVKKKWDYEELGPEKTIDFWVTISNTGSSAAKYTDNQRVIIYLKDVNDEVPYFINRPLPMQAVVQLNAPPNTPVFTLQARDPDTDHSIHYFIVRDRTGGRFEVDERSGVVRTRGTDPFQLDMEYVLYVKAEDQNGRLPDRRFQSTPEERLSIVGGKRPPQFYMPKYEAEIPENRKKDSDIISVKAKSFADREIRYTLKAQGHQGAGTFNIAPSTGIVKLAKELDFEDLRQPHVYQLIVTATEDSGGFSTTVELTIRVTDVNDQSPKFELPDYQAHNVDEDIALETSILKVKATDADSGSNAEIEYLVSDDHFSVDTNGVIRNSKQLDADNNNAYYEFVVTARDKGDPPATGTATVRIYTKNKNDEEPKFSQQVYTPNVDENAGPETLVTTVVASDKDGDNVRFGFVGSGTKSGQFVIEDYTGVIRLHSGAIDLDRDKYELNVTAVDDGSCCEGGHLSVHTSTAVVVVFITDVNDKRPMFQECSHYAPKVMEGAPNGTPVVKVHATDEDKGVNGQVKYSIVRQPNQKGVKFTVNEETGEVFTNKVFDREGDDGKFVSVTVKATDHGDPPLEGVCSFTVEIEDVNDNPPLFDRQKYIENVKQDTGVMSNILRVSASDEDADNNGAIVYSLSAPSNPSDLEYFEIQQESGWIILKKPLDRETYRLEAVAVDKGFPPLSRTVEVQIDVVDRQNQPPVWDQVVYGPVHVKENMPVGAKVISVKASSGIEGNPVVFYRLIRGSTAQTNKYDTFYLQQRQDSGFTWADIKVNHPLDYETNKEYNLTIRVENNGAQQLASEATIYIILEDVNDEIPLFTEREQETVAEGENIGTRVSQVNAIDKDGTAPNNLVKYYIANSEGKDYFEINEFTGEIFTKIVFDREKQAAYALAIEARDSAPSARPNSNGQPNTVTKFIRIGIADKNDNPPYFDKALYEAEVDENEDIQHTVLTVTAKDLDESSRIRYEITKGNTGGAFAVKNMTGAIYVAGPLDYETRKRYDLTLVASDSLNENETTVVMRIIDKNDLPPVFSQSVYMAEILEEFTSNLPLKLTQVIATDGDRDRPQNIVYFLTGQGIDSENAANNKFDINRTTGEIYVLKPLDRDSPNGRAQWRFTVFAQDEGGEGLVGYSDVTVNLKDINDNSPIFPLGIYFGNVTENGTSGMVVMTMTAVDYDDPNEGTNAKLTYSIEKNVIDEEQNRPIFEIEPETGVIKTAVCCLDREKTPDYSIQVVAMDGGGLKGTGTASIRVKDINDMPPHFTKDEWFTEVDETEGSTLPDTPILTVTVHDEDETNNFQFKVLENSGFGADKFTMVRNNDGTGSLKIVQPLDYEDPQQSQGFHFRIQVNDKGDYNDNDKYHVAYAWVRVALRDTNDNKPIFEKPNIEVSVYENAEVGKSLETFKATDPDQGGKSKVSFKIDRSSDKKRQFQISQDGTVTIQRTLDREDTPRHQVKILAIDDGTPSKTATATLTVIVQDINDNAPQFLKDYRPVLPEHTPPRKVVEVLATDDDDRSKGNGPPFTFRMDPNAGDEIKASFKVEHSSKGANGDGMAIVSALRMFDREQRKEFLVPIVIKDSGNPAMSGTSTLTVIIGDTNDHKMQPGSKEIFVYNYQGMNPDTEIGRVYVYDLDDWDLPDKKFFWKERDNPHPKFLLDEDTGTITMKPDVRPGKYELEFTVFDRYHTQLGVAANVTVIVKDLPYEAVANHGSVRIYGISDEDFIRIWDYKTQSVIPSKAEKFKEKLAQILNTEPSKVDVFSVMLKQRRPPITDVRFSAYGSPYFKSVRLNGIALLHREEIEKEVGINITMVNIDECLYENKVCEGSCTNTIDVSPLPYTVNANKTALVGVRIETLAECMCGARNFTDKEKESCKKYECYNGGRCIETKSGPVCHCPPGRDGPRCQITSRSFRANDWAWYSPLEMCEESHLSIEFITKKEDGLLLYNGPMVEPETDELILHDFISLELEKGEPRLLIDFGSGTLELRVKPNGSLSNGEWHRIDVFWDTENVRMVVDFCKSARVVEADDGSPSVFDSTYCQAQGQIPPFDEYLNVNTPLQVGGMVVEHLEANHYRWKYLPTTKAFEGCIRNLVHNSKIYDLANPGHSRHKAPPGCSMVEDACLGNDLMQRCSEHGTCVGTFTDPRCECKPGWMGPGCSIPTVPASFKSQSYVKYALSFEPDRFSTQIQLRFRTREMHGELFRISDQHNREYGILEIKDSRLRFRYNLNSLKTEEQTLWLSFVPVDDGQWHTARVTRYGSVAALEIDGGEGRKYNETFMYEGHQWMMVDKQEGVYAGGKAEYTGHRSFEVYADYQKGCIDDIRLEGKHLPLPTALNGTQWGQATNWRNLSPNCPSNKPCANVICPPPFECVDLWNEYECACGEGMVMSPDEKRCEDRNECLDNPCLNNGVCSNREVPYRYYCECPPGYWGQNCELYQEGQILTLSMGALAAILVCLLIILILVLVFVVYNRRREAQIKYPGPDDDVRENIINYDDEGGGEDDMTAFDITPLQIPVGAPGHEMMMPKMPYMMKMPDPQMMSGGEPNVGVFIDDHKRRADHDPNAPPFDDLRNYAYEGGGSTAGSLSSLASANLSDFEAFGGTDDQEQDFDYLNGWGPRFSKLADMYGNNNESEEDDQ